MPVAAADQALFAVVSGTPPANVSEVIAVMQQIDGCLGNDDGLKWFNWLYLQVTQKVDLQPLTAWQDANWLLALDVVFANFYLRALAGFLSGEADVASSWSALLESRFRPGVDRILFALAGMNAHINHDLALALLATATQTGVTPTLTGPQHADYESVNQLLEALMPAVLTELATDILGMLAQDTGKIGRVLAFWDICKARDLAWGFSDQLRELPGMARDAALDAQDGVTGALGRAILAVG
jgi:hypothetical protein